MPLISPLLLAIIAGVIVANTVTLPARVQRTVDVAGKYALRGGIILLGLQLHLTDLVALGPGALLTAIAVVTIGICATLTLGSVLGIHRNMTLLIACGFSICGAAAVAATTGVTREDDRDESAVAIALVVVFGTAMIPLIPMLGHLFGLNDTTTAMWAGASVHEVAQVVAIGDVLGEPALHVAVVMKLTRVLLLAPVLALVNGAEQRRHPTPVDVKRPPVVPLFVLGFVAMVALRTTGVVPEPLVAGAGIGQTVLLAVAMFALGTGVQVRKLKHVGARPVILAALSTVVVGAVGLTGAALVTA
ncbi:YeiH family protein [Jonesia quinghaiensis]|uniref:YeiH family protein n=1 Tax=Jonesia quinghaiensis TaxID=262806 RepID=UPI0004217E9B|nr:putative sulfate exporter family transporter [Jonesia quinghaiensis]